MKCNKVSQSFIIANNLIPQERFSTQLRSILKDDKNFTTWKLTTKSFSETLVLNYIAGWPSDCVAWIPLVIKPIQWRKFSATEKRNDFLDNKTCSRFQVFCYLLVVSLFGLCIKNSSYWKNLFVSCLISVPYPISPKKGMVMRLSVWLFF